MLSFLRDLAIHTLWVIESAAAHIHLMGIASAACHWAVKLGAFGPCLP